MNGLNVLLFALAYSLVGLTGCGKVWVQLKVNSTPSIGGGAGGGPTIQIYRSIGPGNTSALASGASNAITISGTSATFASALPNNIGVGDAVVYASGTKIAFISGRTSSTQYTLQSASGGTPVTASGDTTWSIYRAYTSLAQAMAGNSYTNANSSIPVGVRGFDTFNSNNDLVANNEAWNFACYADGTDTTAVDTAGWKTGLNNYLRIFTPYLSTDVGVSQRHSGSWNSGGYQLNASSGNYDINIQVNAIRVDGLKLGGAYSGCAALCFDDPGTGISGAGDTYIEDNIIEVPPGSFWPEGIFISSSPANLAGNVYIENNVVFMPLGGSPSGQQGIADGSSGAGPSYAANIYAYNNTVVGSFDFGFFLNGTKNNLVLKNNIVQGAKSQGYAYGGFALGSDYNISSDTTTTGGAHDITNATVAFADAPSGNYLLASYDTAAQDKGENLSSDPNLPFNNDIAGGARGQGAGWDIGAGEAVPSSSNATEMIGLNLSNSTTSLIATALFSGDANANNSATIYYCDNTAHSGCSAESSPYSASQTMIRTSETGTEAGNFTATVTGLTAGDVYNVTVVVSDPDSVSNNDLSGTVKVGPQYVYVSDTNDMRIETFSLGGTYQAQFGNSSLNYPMGLIFDTSNNIWVADSSDNRIAEFNLSGSLIGSFGTFGSSNGQLNTPQAIAINSVGDYYVIDQGNYRIEAFDASGNYLLSFGSKGTGVGQFEVPSGIAVDSASNVYVTDYANGTIQVFNYVGKYLKNIGSSGGGNGQFGNPGGVTFDRFGNLYMTDEANARVEEFDSSGSYASQIDHLGFSNGLPSLSFDSAGNVYVLDESNSYVDIFNSAGVYQTKFGSIGTGNGQFTSPQYVLVH